MKISIITINRNNLPGLLKTMHSVLRQTSDCYEWIVIDGGSTDGSADLLRQNSAHLAYWVSEPDHGIYHAMNKGIDAAAGDYLHFLNSGDAYADDSVLESLLNLNPSADVIYGNAIFVDKNDQEVSRHPAPDRIRISHFWHRGGVNHQATFFSKRCFDVYRYNETNRIASDTELFIHLLYHGYSFQKWDYYVDRFEVGGISSVVQPGGDQEFESIIQRILPPGIKADYDEIIQFRDVDLYQTVRRIIESPRWVRNLARIALLPFSLFLK